MLFDPKWEQQTRVSPLSLGSLIAWLEKQPSGQQYPILQPRDCLLGQWLRASGIKEDAIRDTSIMIGLSPPFNYIAIHQRSTFGAALRRARAALER